MPCQDPLTKNYCGQSENKMLEAPRSGAATDSTDQRTVRREVPHFRELATDFSLAVVVVICLSLQVMRTRVHFLLTNITYTGEKG